MNLFSRLTDTSDRHLAAKISTLVSVVINIIMSTLQVFIGLWANSQALIADGIHSLSDLVSAFVVLIAAHHSRADPDDKHPYGHGRFETAASMVIGLLLLAVGIGMLWSAAQKIQSPALIPTVHPIALGVACLSRWVVQDKLDSGQLVALQTQLPPITRQCYWVVHRDRPFTPALQRWVDLLQSPVDLGDARQSPP